MGRSVSPIQLWMLSRVIWFYVNSQLLRVCSPGYRWTSPPVVACHPLPQFVPLQGVDSSIPTSSSSSVSSSSSPSSSSSSSFLSTSFSIGCFAQYFQRMCSSRYLVNISLSTPQSLDVVNNFTVVCPKLSPAFTWLKKKNAHRCNSEMCKFPHILNTILHTSISEESRSLHLHQFVSLGPSVRMTPALVTGTSQMKPFIVSVVFMLMFFSIRECGKETGRKQLLNLLQHKRCYWMFHLIIDLLYCESTGTRKATALQWIPVSTNGKIRSTDLVLFPSLLKKHQTFNPLKQIFKVLSICPKVLNSGTTYTVQTGGTQMNTLRKYPKIQVKSWREPA